MYIVCWTSRHTGGICEWQTPTEAEAVELATVLQAAGIAASVEPRVELGRAWVDPWFTGQQAG